MRKRAGYRTLALLSTLMLLALATPVSSRTPASVPDVHTVTSYSLDVTLDTARRTLAGTERIVWTNDTGVTQPDVYLRLYPNAAYYHGGALTLTAVTVDGSAVTTAIGDDPTAARIPLPAPVPPGRSATIEFGFRSSIPLDGTGGFGVLRLDSRSGIWALADWYPILAGYDAGQGWYLARPSTLGDPTFSDAATYDVRLTLPAGIAVVGTGAQTGPPLPAGDGQVIRHFTTGAPAREFALAIGRSGHAVSRSVDGVTLRVETIGDPFTGSPKAALVDELEAFTLDVAATAFRAYTHWFGPYNQPDLDVTFLSLEEAQGVSWSGVTWISVPDILDDGAFSDDERVSLAFTVAHEVGHQWLAGIIGSNNNQYGFITEGLDNSLTTSALAGLPLPASANDYWRGLIGGPYLDAVQGGQDGIVDRPVSDSDQGVSRGALVYGKAALGFEAICQRIGPDAYFAGLRTYGQRSWLGISTPAGLRRSLTEAAQARGEDPAEVGVLWDHWFEQADTTVGEVNDVLRHAGGCVPAA